MNISSIYFYTHHDSEARVKKKKINAHQINFTVGNQSYNKTKKKLCLFVYNLAIKYMGGSDLEYCEVYLKSVDIRGCG